MNQSVAVASQSADRVDRGAYLAGVRRYWKSVHSAYLDHVGTTFQAGYLRNGPGEPSARESNERLATAAGILPGHRVLDAGCGVCGPALDIARHIARVRIVGITVSPEQAATARELIRTAGLNTRISVAIGDFHNLPFPDSMFDIVYFFESFGYAYQPGMLLAEVWRVLRPGGAVFIKDVFLKSRMLSEMARRELSEFDRAFAFRTRSPGELCTAMADAGFADIRHRDIAQEVGSEHVTRAMFREGDRREGLTAFGEIHFRWYWELSLTFGEVMGLRPAAGSEPIREPIRAGHRTASVVS